MFLIGQEGVSGLFKGFGAVVLQYTVHFLIIKFSSKIISQVVQIFSNPSEIFQDPRADNSPASALNTSSPDSRSSPRMSKDALTSSSPSVRRRQLPPEFDFTKRYNRTESKAEDQKKSSDEELKASVVDTGLMK